GRNPTSSLAIVLATSCSVASGFVSSAPRVITSAIFMSASRVQPAHGFRRPLRNQVPARSPPRAQANQELSVPTMSFLQVPEVAKDNVMLGTILIIILVLLLVGALPSWPYSTGWGYYPSGGLGLILLIVIILILMGRL